MSIENIEFYLFYYRPQRSCGQGYVFTRVCDSVHRGGLRAEPPRQGEPPWDQADTPQDQADTPWTRQTPPLGPGRQHPPGPGRHHPPGTRQTTPPRTRQTPPPGPGRPPPLPGRRLQHMVNERPVRILLECILVSIIDTMEYR